MDVENGQKTGFFLDQKYNRLAVARLARGRRVLDCFTHTGPFALNAARGGAEHVTAVDVVAEFAVDVCPRATPCATGSAVPHGVRGGGRVRPPHRRWRSRAAKPYDFIILDPPALHQVARRTAQRGDARAIRRSTYRALRLLPRGGYFATASCSHFMPSELFEKMLRSAALDAGVELRQIEARQQSPDHPILWNVPETDYLKFYLFQVV